MAQDGLTEAEMGVLEGLVAEGAPLTATNVGGGLTFRAPLLRVDPAMDQLLLARSGDRAADAALLAQPLAALVIEWQRWRIAFSAEGPCLATCQGRGAIALRMPRALSIRPRREHERVTFPAHATLRCVAHSGAVPVFEAMITNMSKGGLGLLVETSGEALQPGMVLPACRIERQGRDPLLVDLEVRHTFVVTMPDGRRAVRIGCRFVNASPAVLAFVESTATGGG